MASKSSRRIFVTGGSGNVGSAVVTAAVSQGHTVHALSRSTVSDTALRSLGAVPVRGDLAALDILAAEAAAADAVLHLADPRTKNPTASWDDTLRLEAAAVDAMARALEATTKPLVVTSGTLVARADPNGGVTDETAPVNKEIPGYRRWEAEAHALAWAARGVRVVALRMPMCVYGHGKSGPAIFLGVMAKLGVALYVGDGATHVSAVHLDDAARLYLLAAERGKAGDIFNCVSATVAIREVVEAVGAALQLPVQSITQAEALQRLGPHFTMVLTCSNRPSCNKAVELGWELGKEPGCLEDITNGSYKAVAEKIRESAGQK